MLKKLQLEYKINLAQKKRLEQQLELIEVKMENLKATQYDKEAVSGTVKGIDINDLLDTKRTLETELGYIKENIAVLKYEIDSLERTFKELNDRSQLIYLQRYIKNYSITKIAMLNNITERTVFRELKELKERI